MKIKEYALAIGTTLAIVACSSIYALANTPQDTITQTQETQAITYNCYKVDEYENVFNQEIYSQEDYELLAHLIMGECGYCSYEMKYLVGCVVLNRVNSSKFPNTLREVIYQDGQYDCLNHKYFYMTPTDECYEIADKLLRYGVDIPENVIWQAEFLQGKGVYKKLDNMYFCY